MSRHGDTFYRCDQCEFKGTQYPLKGWAPGLSINLSMTWVITTTKNKQNEHPCTELKKKS